MTEIFSAEQAAVDDARYIERVAFATKANAIAEWHDAEKRLGDAERALADAHRKWDDAFRWARYEYVMWLKAQGERTVDIATRLGLSRATTQQLVFGARYWLEHDPRNKPQPQVTPTPLNMPLIDMELSVRTYHCLRNANCKTIGDVVQHTEHELLSMPNFGRRSLLELRDMLKAMGLTMRAN